MLQVFNLCLVTLNLFITKIVMALSQGLCISDDRKKFETNKTCAEEGASTSAGDQTSKVLRSKVKAFNTDLCVFCQQTSKEKTRLAASLSFSKKLLQAAQTDPVLDCRLACANDIVAGDVRYHLKCYVNFTRKAGHDHD